MTTGLLVGGIPPPGGEFQPELARQYTLKGCEYEDRYVESMYLVNGSRDVAFM